MTPRSRAAAVLAIASASIVLLSGCGSSTGSSSGARSTLNYVPTTSYALKEPATTTTSTTMPEITEEPAAGTVSEGEQSYTVKSGDSLSKIASLYDVQMDLICSYNGWPDCGGDHLLLPGDIVLIPPGSLVPAADTSTETADTGTATDSGTTDAVGCTYTIVAGDTPLKVANKYDITYSELQLANPEIDMTTTFVVGYVLRIPANGSC